MTQSAVTNHPVENQLETRRDRRIRRNERKEEVTMHTQVSREATTARNETTPRPSRLDEILARHRSRRVRTVTALVLWTVVCGAVLAL